MDGIRAVDLVLVWHHHQPDYRNPRDGRSELPWVRLHAVKDYLDMALRIERHPGVHVTFNFVPTLVDQLEAAADGGSDALFDLLRMPVAKLGAEERMEVVRRCVAAPRHAFERWRDYRVLSERLPNEATPGDLDLLALEIWFLLAWLDPMFLDAREARAALESHGAFTETLRDALLDLHEHLVGQVVPAYRALAASGAAELSASAYCHPILPLIVDVQTARRAMPEVLLPSEPFAAPEDATAQIRLGLERHEAAFGEKPRGLWPSEGGVSPEVAGMAVAAGLRWIATDEAVLWNSLAVEGRRRESLYQPWRFVTPEGEIAVFFRDHELSDRIGFVYQNWNAGEAAADFLDRVRRIGREQPGTGPAVVTVILDGENCWEHYPEDGGPFLDALYGALAAAPEVRARTPSEVLADGHPTATLPHLHTGSWIDADFHIWIGHPEKNRAWDMLSRARRALVRAGVGGGALAEAWRALYAAEGSDWFWWLGDDHFTSDKHLFDRLFREHLRGVYDRIAQRAPSALQAPIVSPGRMPERTQPRRFIHPRLDGRRTDFYEWEAAARLRLGAGGSAMHRQAGCVHEMHLGFDAERFYLRLDFKDALPEPIADLVLDVLAPRSARLRVRGLEPGHRPVVWAGEGQGPDPVEGAQCAVQDILEIGVPFASLGLTAGDYVEMLIQLERDGRAFESLPPDDLLRFSVPDPWFESVMWSA